MTSKWPSVLLGSIIALEYGKPLAQSDRSHTGTVPAYGANGIKTYTNQPYFSQPSIIVGRKGSAGELHFAPEPFWPLDVTYFVTHDSTITNINYLFYALTTLGLPSLARGVKPGINRNDVYGLRIPLPPLDEQKRIVAKLDEAMELADEKLKNLQSQQKRSPDLLSSKQAELMNPTNEWHEFTVGEVAEIFDGPHATPTKTSEGPWYLSISSLSNGAFDLEKSAHLSELDFPRWTKRTAVRKGDTLFSYETRIGQAGFWDLDEPAALGRRMGILRPLENLVPKFLTEVYLSPQFQDEIKSRTSEGATVDRIPIANMDQWPIRIPNFETQMTILRKLDEFRELCSSLGNTYSRTEMALADLRSSILAAAFAGEL